MTLLGKPLKAHIIAVRPGHYLNTELSKKILESLKKKKAAPKPEKATKDTASKSVILPTETQLDVRRILDTLPHRYPFVMIDRVIDINEEGTKIKAIKNVTINEPFFQGHFPGRPVMPGVLQVEAMAQTAGLVMLRRTTSEGKVAFFMSCDKVKFRRAVEPGDQLVIDVEITKVRGNRIAQAKGECKVGDKVVSSAELMFTIVDANDSD